MGIIIIIIMKAIIMIINLSTVPTMLKAIYLLTFGCQGGSDHHLILNTE